MDINTIMDAAIQRAETLLNEMQYNKLFVINIMSSQYDIDIILKALIIIDPLSD